MDGRRRRKVEHTDDWQELLSLLDWPEQEAYEELRPLVLFGDSVAERARETGTPERTMYRRMERFEGDGMASLFGSDPATHRAKRQGLEPAIRRMIVELKAEHPKLNNNEIKNIVYVRGGRRLGKHTAARVLSEEVVPLKLSRLFEPYHEAASRREAREAVVALHLDGWSVKAIASYLKVSRMTVYRVLGRWLEEGEVGIADKLPGRPKGVRKMDLATMDFIRRAQENPELGAFRVHAALEQKRGAADLAINSGFCRAFGDRRKLVPDDDATAAKKRRQAVARCVYRVASGRGSGLCCSPRRAFTKNATEPTEFMARSDPLEASISSRAVEASGYLGQLLPYYST
jgi:transposase